MVVEWLRILATTIRHVRCGDAAIQSNTTTLEKWATELPISDSPVSDIARVPRSNKEYNGYVMRIRISVSDSARVQFPLRKR